MPLDPGRLSLAHLPDDVVLRVLSFVQDSSPDDVRKIALLSSALYEKARYVQHHTVHIDLDLDQSRRALGHLDVLSHNRLLLLPAIRVLKLSGSKTNIILTEILTLLVDMLPDMTGLRDLHWHVRSTTRHTPLSISTEDTVPIPLSMLDHLPSRVRLHTFVMCEDTYELQDQALAREFLTRFVDNQNLFSLSVQVSFLDVYECRKTMRVLKQMLLSCPNLTSIPLLNVGIPSRPAYHGVADGPKVGDPYCGLGLSDGERPPALEELSVTRYPWGREPKGTFEVNGVYGFYCMGYPEKGTEEHYWAETFDWSRLRRLNDIDFDLALKMAPKLTHLKEAVFERQFNAGWEERTAMFLEEIPTALELLSIPAWSYVAYKPGPITRHGAALRKLKMHRVEQWWTTDSLVTDKDLVGLCNGLPHLEELAIDIARDENGNGNNWPYSALDIIARFLCLRNVQLWFELGDGHRPLTPYLNVSAARQLFSYLRKRNQNIQRLELGLRAPSSPPYWYGDQPCWAVQNSISFVCEVSIRDGDAAEGFLKVTCPDLSREMNAELDRLAKGNREGKRRVPEDAMRLSLNVALDGPLTMDEWTAWRRGKPGRRQTSIFRRFISSALNCVKK
jgi:hypothetical protein